MNLSICKSGLQALKNGFLAIFPVRTLKTDIMVQYVLVPITAAYFGFDFQPGSHIMI